MTQVQCRQIKLDAVSSFSLCSGEKWFRTTPQQRNCWGVGSGLRTVFVYQILTIFFVCLFVVFASKDMSGQLSSQHIYIYNIFFWKEKGNAKVREKSLKKKHWDLRPPTAHVGNCWSLKANVEACTDILKIKSEMNQHHLWRDDFIKL